MSEDMGMEGKKMFLVWKPAEVWYVARVEAGSKEEALARASHPTFDYSEWELDWDTLSFTDADWDVYSDEEDDK